MLHTSFSASLSSQKYNCSKAQEIALISWLHHWLPNDLSSTIPEVLMGIIPQLLVCQTQKSWGWAALENTEAWLLIACMIIPKHMQSHNIAFIWHNTAWKHREENTVLL